MSFGAKPDGKTNNTKAIQQAIDKAAATAGKVVVPAGKFVTGPLILKTGVEFHLQQYGVLLGSAHRLDYGKEKAGALLSANGQSHISITGAGEIDGRGAELVEDVYRLLKAGVINDAEWKTKRPGEANRPKLIHFEECNNIIIKGITIKNGSGWIQDYVRCNNLIIDSITVSSTSYWNNDGIDIANSKNIAITNCYVNASDDAICLKSEGKLKDSCVNVYIADCKLRSSANAFKLGTASSGGFRNIVVRNIEVWDTYRSAIALEAVDGGFLENVDVQNVKAVNTGNAVFIKLGHRNKDERYSIVRNIHIKDMYVEVPLGKPDKGYNMEGPLLRYPPGVVPAKNGEVQSVSPWNHSGKDSTAIIYRHNVFPSSITGLPGHEVKDITLENIEIVYEGGADKTIAFFPPEALTKITEAESAYPEFSMFGELPVWGLYVRHAKDITLKNVTLRYKKEDFRVPVIFDDVQGLSIERLRIPASKEMPVILLHETKGCTFKGLVLPKPETEAIKIQ
ncbi:MAG: glycoside hydrolase family 28 [Chitinophagaceae bacterium]|nr:glycoside hydrolase family 28 [Chitinophagaceae bacterium]